jgi:hypothetical protein
MLEPTPAPGACDRDIAGNAISVSSQYTAQENENSPVPVSQGVAHDWSSAGSETLPDYPGREIPAQEQAVVNGETEADGDNCGEE